MGLWAQTHPPHPVGIALTKDHVCKAFYIGETRRSLLTAWMDTVSPLQFWTQTYQLPSIPNPLRFHFQECWSVCVIHKLPDSTPDHIRRQFETVYQLVLQSQHTPGLNIHKPPNSTLSQVTLKVLIQSVLFYCWGRPLWFGQNINFCFVSSLYGLATLTSGLDDAIVYLR